MPRPALARLLRLALALSPLALAGCETEGAGPCEVAKVAELPLTVRERALFVPVTIDDTPTLAMLDTGAETPVVLKSAMARLKLPSDQWHKSLIAGVGGLGDEVNDATVDRFELAGYDLRLGHYPVIDDKIVSGRMENVSAVVGARLLSHFDVDLDVPGRRITLYSARRCSGRFIPWTGAYAAAPISLTAGDRLIVPVRLNDTPMQALLDTGAVGSVVDKPAAERLGLTEAALARDKAHRGKGAAGVDFDISVHRFGTLQIGKDLFHSPELAVLGRSLHDADMILGFDYLDQRRVWISYRTRQLFIHAP